MTATLPSMTDRRWADAATVHELALRYDDRRPCLYCGVAIKDHTGEVTVLLNEVQPDAPSVFGAKACAERWVDRVPWQPSFRPVVTRDWELLVGTANYGGDR